MKRNGIFQMEYTQVKERVAKEKAALKNLVIGTGIGMFVFILSVVFFVWR